jgi:peptide/nickel transport system permease protein
MRRIAMRQRAGEQLEVTQRETVDSRMLAEASTRERVLVASQWQLMWWKFRKHKAAIGSGLALICFYTIAALCEFIAPRDPHVVSEQYLFSIPQPIHFVDEDGFHLRPFVYGLVPGRDPETLRKIYTVDKTEKYPLHLFVHGDPYELWGIWETDIHLFGIKDKEGTMYLLGGDSMGRDMLSRLLYGTRISLSIGLVGIAISFTLGILIGGASGYYGDVVDLVVQRVIEFIQGIPGVPLWLSLSAALPREWPPLRIYFGITIILSLRGWTGLARVVRGRFLSLREEDFVMAARLAGASEFRIIVRHLVPSFASYIIASLTLSIPGMILSETALSFLGLGLRPPVISWGVLLREAQNIRALAHFPWLLVPGAMVIVVTLCFNFVGDGLRDAADPYRR